MPDIVAGAGVIALKKVLLSWSLHSITIIMAHFFGAFTMCCAYSECFTHSISFNLHTNLMR